MIAVDEAQRKRDAAAQTVEELAERIYLLVGRVVRLEVPRADATRWAPANRAYTAVGILDSLVFPEGLDTISVYLGASSGNVEQRRKVLLSSKVSVLTDGSWVTIHDPKDGDQR